MLLRCLLLLPLPQMPRLRCFRMLKRHDSAAMQRVTTFFEARARQPCRYMPDYADAAAALLILLLLFD